MSQREVPKLPRHWEPLVAYLYEGGGEFAESWDFIVAESCDLAAKWSRMPANPVEDHNEA